MFFVISKAAESQKNKYEIITKEIPKNLLTKKNGNKT